MTTDAIQNLQIAFHSSPETDPVIPEMVTVYHWGRIVTALLALGLVLGILITSFTFWVVSLFFDAPAVSTPQSALPAVVAAQSDALAQQPIVTTPTPNAVAVVEDPALLAEELLAAEPPAAKVVASAAALTETLTEDPPVTAVIAEATDNRHIPSLSLSHDFVGNQPVNPIGATVAMSPEGLIRVYFYTPIVGMNDQRLTHAWYRGDTLMATINMRARSSNTAAHSSKFINRQMLGDWSVKVLDGKDRVLVSRTFTVTPSQD